MNRPAFLLLLCFALLGPSLRAGTLVGHVRDPNWYARRSASDPWGVGYYEFAVNANATNLTATGGASGTDVFGAFSMSGLGAGSYTVASWDVWWRSAYAFGVTVPASGSSVDADVRLKATMWGYPAFWDDSGYHEFGQTFTATGPVTMIYLRDPLGTAFTRTVTVHAGGPGGPQVGVTRTYGGGGDQRLIYGYGEMPTLAGQTYYLRLYTPAPSTGAVIMQMDPRPDFSDPMPGGCLYLGNGTTLTAYPDRDLGVVIMSDDDGLITGLFARSSGEALSGVTSVGQSFVARGVNLISAAFWLADPSAPTYVVRLLENGPSGMQVGTTKRGKPARVFADPEMIVAWAPGECPLVPGESYYLEVTKDGGGTFSFIYANRSNPFPYGQAYTDGAALPGIDLAGTIMEEESDGSATRPVVRFTSDPAVSEINRGANTFTITWTTDVASDSRVEYAMTTPPYTQTNHQPDLVTSHAITLSNLQSHALYHFRASSGRTDYKTGVFRDLTICTRPAVTNLLGNPGFEDGTGAGPSRPLVGWTATGTLDLQAANGAWFGSLPPHSGGWLLQGALNGSTSDGTAYQRITGITAGRTYTFSAWASTYARENGASKYDEWQKRDRLIYVRLGIDPTGGTDPSATTVQWTPRMYSHRHYSNLAKSAIAQGSSLTVFIHMKGDLNYGSDNWHLFGVDDCVLSTEDPLPTEAFNTVPVWDSSFDAVEGSAATFSTIGDGQAGAALQAVRPSPGSSSRVLVFPVVAHTDYAVSIYIRCSASADEYTALTAFKPGAQTGQDLDANAAAWNRLKGFANPGENGNGGVWLQYGAAYDSGSSTQVSVGFRVASTSGTGPAIQWDSLRIEPFLRPVPLRALADRASNSIALSFTRPLNEAAATNPANYLGALTDGSLSLPILAARLTNGTNVILTTGPQASRANYTITVSNVTEASQGARLAFLNGQVPVRVAYPLVPLDDTTQWKYNESGANLGTSWRAIYYNDSVWSGGAALFGYETCTGCLPELIRSPLTLSTNKITFYFRKRFRVPVGVTSAPLRLRHVIDDGAVFYLNGAEIHRIGMTNPIANATLAAQTVGDAVLEGPFDLGTRSLLLTTNVLAVEVHQSSASSSDLVFGAALEALLLPSQLPPLTIQRQAGQVVLTWGVTETGLEAAPTVQGPWTVVPEATSPWTNAASEGKQFFRLPD